MTSELTLLVLRLGFLAVLWIFVFSIIYALRSDLFGTRASEYQRRMEQSRQQTFGAAAPADATGAVPAAAAAGAAAGAATATATRPRSQTSRRRLVVTAGPRRGLELDLANEPLTIGRAKDSGLVIQDDYASTNHARLNRYDDDWVIEDQHSTNGTYVDGERISAPTRLSPGTPVRIGTTTFELR